MSLLPYSRCSFATRLPDDRLYAPSHYWMVRHHDGSWRVGLTTFATRMLGEAVELGFDVPVGERVGRGDAVGWLEGFKALTEVYAPMDGTFLGGNEALSPGIEALTSSPFFSGWLYRLHGEPGEDAIDVHGYARFLDDLIDRMARSRSTP